MPHLNAYYRPETVAEALALLERADAAHTLLAGGTRLVPALDKEVDAVIDLQAAGLDRIEESGERLLLGAMVRLQTVIDTESAPAMVGELARRTGPNTFRNQETVGGTIITADPENEFLAALLVHDAEVAVESADGQHTLPLAEFLADVEAGLRGGILTAVSLARGGEGAHARVARTPADKPIVAAVARRAGSSTRLALCGVAPIPVLVDGDQLDTLSPPADFRGSAAYRQEMASVLARRVLHQLETDN